MSTVEVFVTRNRSSGRIHKRYAEVEGGGFDAAYPLKTARRILVDERCCQTDQSGSCPSSILVRIAVTREWTRTDSVSTAGQRATTNSG